MKRLCCIILCVSLLIVFNSSRVSATNNGISAKSYILMEATTGTVVDAKNENNKMPIASTTKIMTALLALEQENLNKVFTVDSNAIKVEGTSMGLREGDKVSLWALANGMLLSSGNDAANSVAVKLAGSKDKFSNMMNERAMEIGMKNSHFVTPSGLDDKEHYSTAYDMALLARTAIQNQDFLSICSSKKAKVEFGNPPSIRYLKNHNSLLKQYDGCIGIKTGFTKKAGRCLVSAATRDDVTLICVTLKASNDWNDHKTLLDYGFSKIKPIEINSSYEKIFLNVVGSNKSNNKVSVMPLDKTFACVNSDTKLTEQVYIDKFYYAPIKIGDYVGRIEHVYNGVTVATTELVAAQNAQIKIVQPKKTFMEKLKEFFLKHS